MKKHIGDSLFIFLACLLAGAAALVLPVFAADPPVAREKGEVDEKGAPEGVKNGVAISCSFDREEIFVGQAITCTITTRWKPPVQVHPFTQPKTIGDFEVLRTTDSPVQTDRKGGTKSQVFEVQLTCFDVGEKKLPPIEVRYSAGDGEIKTASADPRMIRVKRYIEKLSQEKKGEGQVALRGIKPPLEMPFPLRRTVIIAAAALPALLLVILAVWLLRKWLLRPAKEDVFAPPPLSPDVEALQALAQLELEDAARREAVKPYYCRLSEILRRYLGRRYFFDALEMTSSELIERAHALGWGSGLLQILNLDTAESDCVKFARYVPAHPSRISALERVRQVVMDTRIVQQVSESPVPASEGGEKNEPGV